jgi:serine/threonine-protein kinase HipA
MKCLACHGEIYSIETGEYHPRCSKLLFDTYKPPLLKYPLEEAISIAGSEGSMFLEVQKSGPERRLIHSPLGGFFLRLPRSSFEMQAELESTALDSARAIGVHTAMHGFARFSSGELVFISRRFGREGSVPVVTPKISSINEACRLITGLSDAPGLDAVRFLERIVFCFIAGINDVNFSMYVNNTVGTRLAAAYDLLPNGLANNEQNEIFSLPLNGKKTDITKNDFFQLASAIRVNRKAAENIFEGFSSKIWESLGCMDKGFLKKVTIERYRDFIKERASLINL